MGSVTRTGQCSYDNQATGGQCGQSFAHKMTKLPLDTRPYHRTADGLADDETRTRRRSVLPRRVRVQFTATHMDDQKRATGSASSAYRDREVFAPPQPVLGRQHVMTCRESGGQTGATLATAGRENRAAGTGPHPQPEAVGLGATTVVRLEGALTHSGAPEKRWGMAGHRLAVTVRPRVAALASRPSAPLHNHGTAICRTVIFAHRRQAAAAIDNSTWSRYAALRHPVKPAVCTPSAMHRLWTVT
jgi:hypothetical protein